jgi:hypothetical protein
MTPKWLAVAAVPVAGCALFILCAALFSGCCPAGDAVLSTLTLPAEEQTDGCRVRTGPTLTADPRSLIGDDLSRTPDRSTEAAMMELVGPGALEEDRELGVKYAYAAVYQCGAGDGEVGVSAVMFRTPADAARASRLRESRMDVMFKGQLAAIVWSRGDGCDECYGALRARAERIMGSDD